MRRIASKRAPNEAQLPESPPAFVRVSISKKCRDDLELVEDDQRAGEVADKDGEETRRKILRITVQKEPDVMQQRPCNRIRDAQDEQALAREVG